MDHCFECANFDARQILLCGQAFRWKENEDGSWCGIAGDRYLRLTVKGKKVTLFDISPDDIPFWENYFDLSTDYEKLIGIFSTDSHLKKACAETSGIRILRQDPFETLISFIISQNNNIKRISGIIERLCENFGKKINGGYAFPTPSELCGVTAEQLAPLRAGFRAKYIEDAVNKITSGDIDLDAVRDMDTQQGRETLKKIKGVGDKVADCVLLFGYHKTDAFPKDVWIKRVLEKRYPDGFPKELELYGGIAQQYLFDYERRHAQEK